MSKKNSTEIPSSEVKKICKEYRLSNDDMMNLTDEDVALKEALNRLSPSDYVLFCLYSELASERKLASMLGISRSPISKEIKRIRNLIKEYLDDDGYTYTDTGDGGFRP